MKVVKKLPEIRMKQFYGIRTMGLILTLAQIIELENNQLSVFQDRTSICIGYVLEDRSQPESLAEWDTSLIKIILKDSHRQIFSMINKLVKKNPKNVVVGNFYI